MRACTCATDTRVRVPCPSSTGIAGNIIGKSVTELRSGDSMGSGRKQRDSVRERATAMGGGWRSERERWEEHAGSTGDERIDHRSNCYKIGVRSRLKSGYGYSLLSSLMLANPLDPNEFRPFDINLRVT